LHVGTPRVKITLYFSADTVGIVDTTQSKSPERLTATYSECLTYGKYYITHQKARYCCLPLLRG